MAPTVAFAAQDPPAGTSAAAKRLTATTSAGTPRSPSFRHSVHLIPTPGALEQRPKLWQPAMFKIWAWGLHSALMLSFAVGIEVALYFSNRSDGQNKPSGFEVHQNNIFDFHGLFGATFLLSFFPTFLVYPLAYCWSVTWFWFRLYQPYITLAAGDAPATASVGQNYLTYNKFEALYHARKQGHKILFTTGWIGFGVLLFQPLASSLFELNVVTWTSSVQGGIPSKQTLGLSPDTNQLNGFVAAAGYAEASALHNLTDPPFVQVTQLSEGVPPSAWTVASVKWPDYDQTITSNVSVLTTAVYTQPNCAVAVNATVSLQPAENATMTFVAPDGFGSNPVDKHACSGNVRFDSTSATQQYGVAPLVNCTAGASAGQTQAPTNATLQPVVFWFFGLDAGVPTGTAILCAPTINVFNVRANLTANTGAVIAVTKQSDYTNRPNSVQDGELKGAALNGVVFDTTTDDSFVRARAIAVGSGLSGAILRFVETQPGGLPSAFADPASTFLVNATTFYTRHLALAASAVYFTPTEGGLTVQADLTTVVQRLFLHTFTAHALAAILFVTGFSGLVLHLQHRRARRHLFLAHTPGSLASTVALTGRSGFGELLVPYETDKSLTAKLRGLRFRLDERTGAVLADGDVGYDEDEDEDADEDGAGKAGAAGSEEDGKADDVQMRLLSPDDALARAGSASTAGASTGRPTSNESTAVGSQRGARTSASAGVLDIPYEWEPLPELGKTQGGHAQ